MIETFVGFIDTNSEFCKGSTVVGDPCPITVMFRRLVNKEGSILTRKKQALLVPIVKHIFSVYDFHLFTENLFDVF